MFVSSGAGESHPYAVTETDVSLLTHLVLIDPARYSWAFTPRILLCNAELTTIKPMDPGLILHPHS